VEVTFDIDANGIVHVSAKDLGTGKEQSIQITASSGLSDQDIERMVKEAESHADEDKKKQELIEVRNNADTLVYTTEKSLRDMGDKVDAALKAEIESKAEAVKEALKSDDPEAIKRAHDELSQASHKLAEQLYAQQNQQAQGGPQGGPQPGAQPGGPQAGKDDEDVVDADYTEVK
jgi:molecular chaperone DnaK